MTVPQLQSVARPSAFTRLDFRAKAAVLTAISVVAVCWDAPWLSAGLTVVVLVACRLAGIPRAYLQLMIRVMLPFFLLLLATHGFFNVGHVLRITGQATLTPLFVVPTEWWLVGGMRLSREGLLYGVNVISKSLTFLLLVPLGVFTTDPNQLVVGLVRLRLPYRLAFLVSATLRFFPLIFDEIAAVSETQRLRGHVPAEMGALERLRSYAGIAVPVILSAMFKAQHIEVVLQARAFPGGADRTYLHASRLRGSDWMVIAFAALAVGTVGFLRVATGFGRFGG